MKRMKLSPKVDEQAHKDIHRIVEESGLGYSQVVRLIVDTGIYEISKQLKEIKK